MKHRVFFFLLILVIYFIAGAETIEVSGEQSGIWRGENTYQIVEDVNVVTGDTLIVEPGAIIEFMGYYEIVVRGTILAVGTYEDSILFTYDFANQGTETWEKIYVSDSQSSNSVFSYCIFEYASTCLWCADNSNPLICNNNFRFSYSTGVRVGEASPTILDNRFDGFRRAIKAEYAGAELIIRRNIITNSDIYGIECVFLNSCVIEDNLIRTAEQHGITCNGGEAIIRNNVVSGTGSFAIWCRLGSNSVIKDNLVMNSLVGIYLEQDVYTGVINNTIVECKTGFYCDEDNTGIDIINNIFYDNYLAMHLELPITFNFGYNLYYSNSIDLEGDVIPEFGEICTINNNNHPCDSYYDIFMNPQFTDPELDYYTLAPGSPAIDAGNDDVEYLDPDGTIADIGAYYYPQAAEIPIAAFTSDVIFGEPFLTVNFQSESEGDIDSFFWDFGDEHSSIEENPVHEYVECGLYTVSLTVSGPAGTDTCLEEDYIMVMPEIEVSGNVSGEWTSEYCYCIIGDITISHLNTLTIEPGTLIRFMGLHSMTVTGTLIAEGTENDSIRFTSGNRRPFEGDWDSILFNFSETESSVISHVIFEYGDVGIYLYNADLTISDCRISDNYCGIEIYDASPLIDHNYITGNYEYGITIHNSVDGTISNNSFFDNDIDIFLYYDNSPVITANVFRKSKDRAIKHSGGNAEISYNQFIDNPIGIIINDSESFIHHNLFTGSGEYGIRNFGNDEVILVSNNTFCNLPYGIQSINSAEYQVTSNIFYGNIFGLYSSPITSSVDHNLFYNNSIDFGYTPPDWFGVLDFVNLNVDPCDVNSNIFMHPEFVDPQSFDFHLTANSPCLNAGNPDPAYNDPDGSISDIGAFYYQQIVDNDAEDIPASGITLTNYPNPFNPSTSIEFNIPQSGTCSLGIYNIKGELVKTILSDNLEHGKHSLTWDGKNNNNKTSASGIYFYRLKTADQLLTKRMLLLK